MCRKYTDSAYILVMNINLGKLSICIFLAVVVAIFLSIFFSVPYVFSAVGFVGLLLAMHLAVFDEDFPRGWSNPDGSEPVPWRWLAIKGVIFFVLLSLVFIFPELHNFGR